MTDASPTPPPAARDDQPAARDRLPAARDQRPAARDELPAVSRGVTLALCAALGVWALLCALAFSEQVWRPFIDSAVYVLAAKSLAAGDGYSYLGETFFQHPPGLSVLLMPFAGETIDFAGMNRLIQCCAAGSFLVIALALARRHGAAIAALAALLFAINPLAVRAQNAVLTEYPFLLFFFLGAWLVTPRRGADRVSWVQGLLGAVLLAASIHLRTVALIAVPALALAGLFQRGGRRWQGAGLAAIVLALSLPWLMHARAAADRAPPTTQFKAIDYSTAMFREDGQDPTSPLVGLDVWGERVVDNAANLTATVGRFFLGGMGGGTAVVFTLLLAAALVFTWLDRRSMLDWYAMGSVAVLLTMYFYDDRFVMPVLPLLISALLHACWRLGRALSPSPNGRAVYVAVASLLLVFVAATGMAEARAEPANRLANRVADEQLAEWLAANTKPAALVLADRAPIVSVLSGRTVYAWRHLPGGAAAKWPEVDWAVLGPGMVVFEPRLRRAAVSETSLRLELPDKTRTLRVYRMRPD
ncbi:MAG: hypothetical protein ACYTCU_02500 [Planctomycetota bacterium]|jgi:4-amino-4-deoxy-L-arabinose transferase-like glycosyltransferase